MEKNVTGKVVFATTPASGGDEREVVLLARSIRRFGGVLAGSPVWVCLPQGVPLGERIRTALSEAGVRIIPYTIPAIAVDFPFAGKVYAASAAEEMAQAKGAELLVWMDADTLVIHEPREFILEKNHLVGCRPVHLTLISSLAAAPLDDFWAAVYQRCGVVITSVYTIKTIVDQVRIRANFNAGLLVLRPQTGLLREWGRRFGRILPEPEFERFYQRNKLYLYFVHQAVLAGCILAHARRDQIKELSDHINYPVFLHQKMPVNIRVKSWDRLTTVRYDRFDFFANPGWKDILQVKDPLLGWLNGQIDTL